MFDRLISLIGENSFKNIQDKNILVLGLGGAILTIQTGDVSVSFTGMSLAAIIGIILNLILPKTKEANLKK